MGSLVVGEEELTTNEEEENEMETEEQAPPSPSQRPSPELATSVDDGGYREG